MWTRMSRFNGTAAVMVIAGLLSGCTAANTFWRGQPRQTVQAPTLPIVPSAGEYQSYANTPAQPQFGQSCARGGCGCSRGGGCGSGSCCSGGSCNANVATGPIGPPQNQFAPGVTQGPQMAQQNPPQPAAASYGGQKTCPVTGEALGSMGPPVPVTVKGQTIYVCCEGCVEKVQRDPDQYLGKAMRERSGQ